MEEVATLVARHYEAHAYPEPFPDIAAKLDTGYVQMGDPALYSPALWPEGRPRRRLRILSAGCGTVQAAVLAYTNRDCEIVGVDLSRTSLQHQRFLQQRHGLTNLRLFLGDIRDAAQLGAGFDCIVCTGVLHHLDDPGQGLRALAGVLADDGVFVGMVYGATRRTGVYMVQDALRRLGTGTDQHDLAFVRRLLQALPAGHFVHRYLETAGEMHHDAALVDTFLHPQDRAYTVPQLFGLLDEGGLAFQAWTEPSRYWPEAFFEPGSELLGRIRALDEREQWAVVEMLTAVTATHVFYARPAALDPAVYRIDFGSEHWRGYVPVPAPGIQRVGEHRYTRGAMNFELEAASALLVGQADGRRCIGELLAHPALADNAPAAREAFGRELFERLWKLGHVMILNRSTL